MRSFCTAYRPIGATKSSTTYSTAASREYGPRRPIGCTPRVVSSHSYSEGRDGQGVERAADEGAAPASAHTADREEPNHEPARSRRAVESRWSRGHPGHRLGRPRG